jgi:hypothetical protein
MTLQCQSVSPWSGGVPVLCVGLREKTQAWLLLGAPIMRIVDCFTLVLEGLMSINVSGRMVACWRGRLDPQCACNGATYAYQRRKAAAVRAMAASAARLWKVCLRRWRFQSRPWSR